MSRAWRILIHVPILAAREAIRRFYVWRIDRAMRVAVDKRFSTATRLKAARRAFRLGRKV